MDRMREWKEEMNGRMKEWKDEMNRMREEGDKTHDRKS